MNLGQRLTIIALIFGNLILALILSNLSGIFKNIDTVRSGGHSLASKANDKEIFNVDSGVISDFSTYQHKCEISCNYPGRISRWCDLITRYSNRHGLQPDLVAAVILLESGGVPDALSLSGAVGLMQVMRRDGSAANFLCVNEPCFQDRPPSNKLKDPEFNIKYGTRVLANLINKSGSIRDAFKACGPLNVGYTYADQVLGV